MKELLKKQNDKRHKVYGLLTWQVIFRKSFLLGDVETVVILNFVGVFTKTVDSFYMLEPFVKYVQGVHNELFTTVVVEY